MIDLFYAASLGLIAGTIPVYLGLIPVFFVRRVSSSLGNLLASFATGILLFLFVDVMGEALELSKAPGSSPSFLVVGLVFGLLVPAIASNRRKVTNNVNLNLSNNPLAKNTNKIFLAYMIALGIGLHNFGEGLALGASYAAGAIGLTALLVVGFALHNGTEGFGIAAPVSNTRIGVKAPLLMGFVAGVPTLIGSMVGALAYSESLGALFFAAAAGALLFVIVQIVKISFSMERSFLHLFSILLGILLMYFTGLIVP